MKAEIITIGDEILIGQTRDTNSSFIAHELNNIGIEVQALSTVPDEEARITGILDTAMGRSELIIFTGGLGPTNDDITKKTLSDYFGTRLVLDPSVLAHITAMLDRRGVGLNPNNMGQAYVPESCRVLPNMKGTAPGMWFDHEGKIIISLPGVPFEMEYLIKEQVVPDLIARGMGAEIMHSNIMTCGMPEAHLAEKLGDFEAELPQGVGLAYLPSSGIIKLRLTIRHNDPVRASAELATQVGKLKQIIPELIFAEEEISLEEALGSLLLEKGLSLATAESCSGGNIGRMITSVPGSSAWYKGGVIAYSNGLKRALLGVSEATLVKHGAVSRECAAEMAEGIRQLSGSDIAVATTGIAGPGGGSAEKPVGTVFIAIADPDGVYVEDYIFSTDRQANIRRSTIRALNLLRLHITRPK